MNEELEEIKKFRKNLDIYLNFVYFVSAHIAYIFRKQNISPNLITCFTLLLGFLFATSLAFNQLVLASIFVFLIPYSDTLDGLWARYKKKTSDFGAIFDPLVDRYNSIIIFFSLGVYAYFAFNNVIFLILPGVLFTLSHLPLEFEYYLEKYRVKKVIIKEKKSLIFKIVYEIFGGSNFFLTLPLILIFYPYELGFLALFIFEIFKRILWVVKLNYTIAKMYLNRNIV